MRACAGTGEAGDRSVRGKEGISGHWAVRRERGQPGWLTVGPRGWLALAVTGNTDPPGGRVWDRRRVQGLPPHRHSPCPV